MDALKMARENMERFEDGEFADAGTVLAKAQAYAAIAQAEQLKRIADMFANYFDICVDSAITQEYK